MTIKGLTGKLVEKRGKMAQINIDGQDILVPCEFLPANLAVGEEISIYFSGAQDAAISEKKLAKSILEEILNGN